MKKMKAGLVALSALIAMNMASPQKAEAGILLVAATGGGAAWVITGTAVAVTGTYLAVFTAVDPDEAWFVPQFAIPTGIAALVLDADGALPADAIAQSLASKYSFIDNRETISELALAIHSKVPTDFRLKSGEEYLVSLPAAETREILQHANLTDEQTQEVVNGLI